MTSYLYAELEEPKIGISGKGLTCKKCKDSAKFQPMSAACTGMDGYFWGVKSPFYRPLLNYHLENNKIFVQVGSASDMISQYEEALSRFEKDESVNEEAVSIRYEKCCRVV